MKKPSGYVIYDGPSLIDGKPIIAVAITKKSTNSKTGGMVQTYIIRKDVDPRQANKSGADYSICGDCPHKGEPTSEPTRKLAKNRTCYVRIDQGALIVWKAYKRGIYPTLTDSDDIAAIAAGRMIRLGTYGDPAVIPSHVWDSLLKLKKGHTAYSHQSGIKSADVRHDLYMTSADSASQANEAWSKGRRTFRVISAVSEKIKGEILCPASEEMGRKTTCENCGLCAGNSIAAKSIAIVAHGTGKNNFQKEAA